MMGKDDLKKNNPTMSDTKKVKQKAKEMQEKGITSEAKAKEYFELLGISPSKTFNGMPVEVIYMSSDGQPFYTVSDVSNHIRKMGLKKEFYSIKV